MKRCDLMLAKSEKELDEEWFNEWLDEHCEKQTQENVKNDVNDNGHEYLTKKGAAQWAFILFVVIPLVSFILWWLYIIR